MCLLTDIYDHVADDFLELSSHQRLSILFGLLENKSKVTMMAKKLGATTQEVSRNFERLSKAGLIQRDSNGFFHLTTFGESICTQVPSLVFISTNRKYFEKHNFAKIPQKFIQRIGALSKGDLIQGFVKVQEKWKNIYQNANSYIYNVLTEVPYTKDLMDPLVDSIKKGVEINTVFADNAILQENRDEILQKYSFHNLMKDRQIMRRIKKDVAAVTILNEKEACVAFSFLDGNVDLSHAFYSTAPEFHEWCLDFFRHCWHDSQAFYEDKLKK